MLKSLAIFFANLGKFWQENYNYRLLRFTLTLMLFQIITLIWFYPRLPPQVPLFFSRPWGSQWLASPSSLFFLPAYTLLTFLLNYSLALYYHQKKPFLAKLLVTSVPILAVFSTIAVLKIINLVL